jgi:hypothetical protein
MDQRWQLASMTATTASKQFDLPDRQQIPAAIEVCHDILLLLDSSASTIHAATSQTLSRLLAKLGAGDVRHGEKAFLMYAREAMTHMMGAGSAVVATRCAISGVDGQLAWMNSAMINTDEPGMVMWALQDITGLIEAEVELNELKAEFEDVKDRLNQYEDPSQIKWIAYNGSGAPQPGGKRRRGPHMDMMPEPGQGFMWKT